MSRAGGAERVAIRSFRLQLGMSQKQLAHALAVHVATVSRWERGVQRILCPRVLSLAMSRLILAADGVDPLRPDVAETELDEFDGWLEEFE